MVFGQKGPVTSPGDGCLAWSLCTQLLQGHAAQKEKDSREVTQQHQGGQLIIHPPFSESPGRICLPPARSTNPQTQLPFIPRQVRGRFLKHC